jgi:putative salt-induced outer membrane protein YdiY
VREGVGTAKCRRAAGLWHGWGLPFRRLDLRVSHFAFALLALVALCGGTSRAQQVILHLKNGDRLMGTILREDTNQVVITTSWTKELIVPVAEIDRRETTPISGTVQGGAPTLVATNIPGRVGPGAGMPVTSVPSLPLSKSKPWKVEAKIGADFLEGAKDQELYYGRFKLTYQRPYADHPKEYFRNILDYGVDYGRTEGVVSANRMQVADKTDFDIGKKYYLYNLLGVGYDEIRKIDLQYEIGPGLGYHLLTPSNFVANVEAGIDYQVQYRSDQTTTKDLFPRLAEDVTWKINHRLTFSEKVEIFPPAATTEYRARIESNLSYAFWQNLSLNLSVLDLYDSEPAQTVPNNDLQIRSSLGITF